MVCWFLCNLSRAGESVALATKKFLICQKRCVLAAEDSYQPLLNTKSKCWKQWKKKWVVVVEYFWYIKNVAKCVAKKSESEKYCVLVSDDSRQAECCWLPFQPDQHYATPLLVAPLCITQKTITNLWFWLFCSVCKKCGFLEISVSSFQVWKQMLLFRVAAGAQLASLAHLRP